MKTNEIINNFNLSKAKVSTKEILPEMAEILKRKRCFELIHDEIFTKPINQTK